MKYRVLNVFCRKNKFIVVNLYSAMGVCMCMIIFLGSVSAYTISHNRVLRGPSLPLPTGYTGTTTSTTTTLEYLIINRSQITQINSLHGSGEAWAYQEGYADAVSDIRTIIGLRHGGFHEGPKYPTNTINPYMQTCFCYNQSFAKLIEPYVKNLTRQNFSKNG
jgi:hypothetical protein